MLLEINTKISLEN